MGQRLNVEIIKDGEVIANAYYHWSAYTSSGFEIAKRIIQGMDTIEEDNPVIYAVKLLELTGSGLIEDEREYLKEVLGEEYHRHEFKSATSRNEGLTSVSPTGIQDTQNWEEGGVYINLTDRIVDQTLMYEDSVESYIEDFLDEDQTADDIPILTMPLNEISFDEFVEVANSIHEMIDKNQFAVRPSSDSNTVIMFVE